jgi:hypothetical protein
VKPAGDMLATVPDAPPAAGPDRALDAPPPDPLPPAKLPATTGLATVAERDVAKPTETPITAHIAAAVTMIHRRLLFARNCRSFGRRGCVAVGVEADPSGADPSGEVAGGGGGVAPVPPAFPAVDGFEVVLDTGPLEMVSRGFVGLKSLIMALLLLG